MSEERADSTEGAPFARDFGYLAKFLVAVEEHAASVGGARGDRLRELLAGEVERFAEIRSLLSGAEPATGPTVEREDAPSTAGDLEPSGSASSPLPSPAASPRSIPPAVGRELTVGSLLGDRRRTDRDSA